MFISCQEFIQVRHSQLIHPPTHAYSPPSCHHTIISSITSQSSKNRKGNTKLERILAQPFAQAEGSRSGERDSCSGELSLPRQELKNLEQGANAIARLGELSSPEKGIHSLKTRTTCLSEAPPQ